MDRPEKLAQRVKAFAQRARKVKRYGWVRDLPDHRDVLYSAALTALPLAGDECLRNRSEKRHF